MLVNNMTSNTTCVTTLVLLISMITFLIFSKSLKAEENSGLREITKEELINFPFENPIDYAPPLVEELSLGQQFILDSQRKEIEQVIIRRLGVTGLKGNIEDLKIVQQVIDKRLISKEDTKAWQSLGIVFGDLLAAELDLHWVNYKDEQGESRALRWRKTMNFIFPVTFFSKRIQFGQPLDAQALFTKIRREVESFPPAENRFIHARELEEKSILTIEK